MTDIPKTDGGKPEMQTEISALIGAVAKAFGIPEAEVVSAVERGDVTMDFGRDANGNRFVEAGLNGRSARIYQGAIKHPGDTDAAKKA